MAACQRQRHRMALATLALPGAGRLRIVPTQASVKRSGGWRRCGSDIITISARGVGASPQWRQHQRKRARCARRVKARVCRQLLCITASFDPVACNGGKRIAAAYVLLGVRFCAAAPFCADAHQHFQWKGVVIAAGGVAIGGRSQTRRGMAASGASRGIISRLMATIARAAPLYGAWRNQISCRPQRKRVGDSVKNQRRMKLSSRKLLGGKRKNILTAKTRKRAASAAAWRAS